MPALGQASRTASCLLSQSVKELSSAFRKASVRAYGGTFKPERGCKGTTFSATGKTFQTKISRKTDFFANREEEGGNTHYIY
jgi:hypothetical protein